MMAESLGRRSVVGTDRISIRNGRSGIVVGVVLASMVAALSMVASLSMANWIDVRIVRQRDGWQWPKAGQLRCAHVGHPICV